MFRDGLNKTLVNLFFNFIFIVLYLLSFFLIESEYKFYLFSFWSVFLLLFIKLLNKNVIFRKLLFITFLLSIFFILNTFFSTNVPLSIEKLFFYIISLSIFVFFQNLNRIFFNKETFLHCLSIAVLILNAFVLFFIFYAPTNNIFPGMNLISNNYGHNHYAAFLLLVIPVFWWQFLFAEDDFLCKKDIKLLSSVLLVSSYLLIIASLARLVLIFSLLQLIVILFLNKRTIYELNKSKLVISLISTFMFVFLLICVSFLFLSFPVGKKDSSLCYSIFPKKEICQSIAENDRLIYWRQAIRISSTHKMFGSGLKTFGYASRLFPLTSQTTSYAHNIFLNNLAETGFFVGGIFIIFIIYVFYLSFRTMMDNKQKLDQFLWIAAFFSLINAMFDFDWNFFVIFVLTLVFLAIILSNGVSKDVNSTISKLKLVLYLKIYLFFVSIASCFLGIAYISAVILLKNEQIDLFVKYFPFFEHHAKDLFASKKLSNENYEWFFPLYKNDLNFIYSFATTQDLDMEKRVKLQVKLAGIDPVFFIQKVSFDNANYSQAKPLAEQFILTGQRYRLFNNMIFLDYWKQRNVAVQLFTFGNQAYKDRNLEVAISYYQMAIILNPLIMSDAKAYFLDDLDPEQSTTFLKSFKDFNPESMGEYFYQYMNFYERTLIYLFKNDRLDDFFMLSEAMFKQQPNFSWFLFRDIINSSKTVEDRQRLKEVHDHFQDMKTWHDFLPLE